MRSIKQWIGFALVTTLIATGSLQAQSTDTHQGEDWSSFNRFSVGLQGGLATGNMNIDSKYSGVYGANVRYSINPIVSVQANALFGEIISSDVVCELFDPSFNNNFSSFGLQGHFNMYQLLSRDLAPYGFSIYSLLGAGVVRNNVETSVMNPEAGWEDVSGEDNKDIALYYQFGLGTRIKLSSRVDLFSQFDYNVTGSDKMDGFSNSVLTGTDLDNGRKDHFLNFTAGLQFKLGPSGRKHAEWDWPAPPPPPPAEPAPRVDVEQYEDRIDELEDKLDEKQQAIDELYDRMRQMEDVSDVEKTDNGVMVTFDNDILFEFDSSDLKPEAIRTLQEFMNEIGEHEALTLSVVGHTCNIGTEEYNQDLSERRAQSVTDYLIGQGFDPQNINSEGRGELEPKFDNDTAEGRALNRRVEILIENQ